MQRAVVNQSAEGGHVALVLAHKGLELPEDRAVEELKLRRERGETIDVPLRSNKPVLLAALVRARAAAPDVPRPAAAPAAAAAGGGGEALIAPTDGVEKLVGQRVEAVWEDKDGSTDWFPATIVAHWPTTSEHDRLLMHFDDGMDEIIRHAARRHRAPDRRGCCCAVQVCPVCCPARGRGWRLHAAASAASAAAAAELAQVRPKPGLNLVCLIGSPTQAEPCLDPVYRKQD